MEATEKVVSRCYTLAFLREAACMLTLLPKRPPRMPPQSTMLKANAKNTSPARRRMLSAFLQEYQVKAAELITIDLYT
jgi:hypothetical protein